MGFYIGKYYAVTFYNIKYSLQDRDPGGSAFLDFSRLLFTDPYFGVGMLRGGGVTQGV